jgi:hypothetical protein
LEPYRFPDRGRVVAVADRIIFLPEPVKLTKKKYYYLSISYESSSSPLTGKINLG